jgi:hypothetical protein
MYMQQRKSTEGGCNWGVKSRVLVNRLLSRQGDMKRASRPWIIALLLVLLALPVLPALANAAGSDKSYIRALGSPGKYLMHLEGTPYQMGYAMGHLRPGDVVRLVHGEYAVNMLSLVLPILDKGIRPVQGALVDDLLRMPGVQDILDAMARDVPYEFKLEMKGIADGTNEALHYKAVTYHHILLVNLFPALQSLVTSGPLVQSMQGAIRSCQDYVAFGKATYDGRTLMGRHFMWVSDPLHEITYMVEYVPSKGKRFVSVSFPGMVGVSTGMNAAGIGLGSDFFNATGTPRFPDGLGMWFLGRKIVQYAGSIADAERMIRASDEAAPCFMVVGDASGAGAVFEIYDHKVAPRYAGWVPGDPNGPDQIESKDDLVVVSNHSFTPGMYPLDAYPPSSMIRYQVLTDLLLGSYGRLDQISGRSIIDFMHPPSRYLDGTGYDGYGNDPAQPVKQCVALMDLKARTIWALYGHYNDPWVEYTLH